MVTTRSADKEHSASGSGGHAAAAGEKHDMDEKPSPKTAKRPKTQPSEDKKQSSEGKKQKTIEQSLPVSKAGKLKRSASAKKSTARTKPDTNVVEPGAVETGARDASVPSSILEKGIVYFFFRGRIGVNKPGSVDDVSRSYFILRPIDKDAKLGEGTIGDAGNSRLISIPKKVLPLSARDRWIAFVEKVNVSFQTLKDEFLASSDHETKTAGTRHVPAATPIGEGIYAITTTGRESHLAYMLTLPAKLGEVQEAVGLQKQGSFIISTRNPNYPPPNNATLPRGPDFTQDIKKEFRALRWMPSQPKHLNFVNTQFLLIGAASGIQGATKPQEKDAEAGQEEPREEMEKLEDEDTRRMQDLEGDDSAAIFADLEANAKDYPKLQTTF